MRSARCFIGPSGRARRTVGTHHGLSRQTTVSTTRRATMATLATRQGTLALLHEPVAQTLLQSAIPARLAYLWTDGTPRVTPVWFQWTGAVFVTTSLPLAPKLKALAQHPEVALTIDT